MSKEITPKLDNKYFNVFYYSNKYTGEVLPYKTVASVEPDKGIENTGEDLCRKEDFEPISACVKRFLNSGVDVSHEFMYTSEDAKNIDLDQVDDHYDPDADLLDQQMDVEDYLDGRYASGASVSAVEAEKGASDECPQVSEEQAPSEAEEKPSE